MAMLFSFLIRGSCVISKGLMANTIDFIAKLALHSRLSTLERFKYIPLTACKLNYIQFLGVKTGRK